MIIPVLLLFYAVILLAFRPVVLSEFYASLTYDFFLVIRLFNVSMLSNFDRSIHCSFHCSCFALRYTFGSNVLSGSTVYASAPLSLHSMSESFAALCFTRKKHGVDSRPSLCPLSFAMVVIHLTLLLSVCCLLISAPEGLAMAWKMRKSNLLCRVRVRVICPCV